MPQNEYSYYMINIEGLFQYTIIESIIIISPIRRAQYLYINKNSFSLDLAHKWQIILTLNKLQPYYTTGNNQLTIVSKLPAYSSYLAPLYTI